MRSLEWAPIQYDWCPQDRTEFGYRWVQKKDRGIIVLNVLKTEEEDGCVHAKEEA